MQQILSHSYIGFSNDPAPPSSSEEFRSSVQHQTIKWKNKNTGATKQKTAKKARNLQLSTLHMVMPLAPPMRTSRDYSKSNLMN